MGKPFEWFAVLIVVLIVVLRPTMTRARSPAIAHAPEGWPLREMAQSNPDFPSLPLYEARMGRHFAVHMANGSGETSGNPPSGKRPIGKRAAFVRGLLKDLTVMTGIGLFLGVLGPFGTINQELPERLISWLLSAYLGYICYRPMAPLVDWAERALDLPRLGLWVAAVLIATVPMTFAVLSLGNMRGPFFWPGLDVALTSYFYVFVVGGAVTLLFNLLGRGSKAPATVSAVEPVTVPDLEEPSAQPEDLQRPTIELPTRQVASNPLLDQLPPALGSDVIALEMEDHYVRVHTSLGSEMVLMRLRDAMIHVSDIEGRQVHRSWWVARLAVEDVRREGRNVRLVLPSGLEAPVARAQVAELKNAGWL